MKNSQKGFIIPFIAIAVVLLTGGSYLYFKNVDKAEIDNNEIQSSNENNIVESPKSDWKTYVDKKHGFQLNYPGRDFDISENPDYVTFYPLPQPIEFGPFLRIVVKGDNNNLDTYLNNFIDKYKLVLSKEVVNINGVQWIKLKYKDTSGDGPSFTYDNYFLSKNGHVYRVFYNETSKKNNQYFENIISSFKFIEDSSLLTADSNLFRNVSIKDVHIGDIFGTLKVTKINTNFLKNSEGNEYLSSMNVDFSGKMIILGKVFFNEMSSGVCVHVDEKDVNKIPRFKEDDRSASFCLSGRQNMLPPPLKDLKEGNPNKGLILNIEIENYKVYFAQTASSDSASFVRINPSIEGGSEASLIQTTTDYPKVITCNPSTFDPDYFKNEKPCTSDMNSIDIERENKALSIITKSTDQSLKNSIFYPPELRVSDKRYQVMFINNGVIAGFVVVDTVGERISDYFSVRTAHFIEKSSKRFVFIDYLSEEIAKGSFVKQYVFGKEKSVSVASSEVYYPQTYFYSVGPANSASIKILASTTNSFNLGIYDQNKPIPRKPGEDFDAFEQVGNKEINLSN